MGALDINHPSDIQDEFRPLKGQAQVKRLATEATLGEISTDTVAQAQSLETPSMLIPTDSSLSTDTPRIPLPREERDIQGNVITNKKEAVNTLKSNPWWDLSFLGAFLLIMNELSILQCKIYNLEAQTELEARNRALEFAKTNAEITKALYQDQAMEKMVEAISNAATAVSSSITLVQATRNTQAATTKIEGDIKDQQALLTQTKIDANWEKEVINNQETGRLRPPDNWSSTADPEVKQNIKKLEDRLQEMESKKSENIRLEDNTYYQKTNIRREIMNQAIQSASQAIQSLVKLHEAELEYQKQMNEGYLQALQKFNDTSAKARDDAKASFDRAMDFLNKITDSDFKAHSLGHSA